MNTFTLRRGLVAFLVLAVTIVGGAGTAAADAAAPYCGITWGSLAKDQDVMSPAPLSDIRTGQHPCFDRVVLDFQGSASGYQVAYADNVYSQGRGDRLDITGGARLSVVLLDPADDVSTGVTTYPHAVGEHVADVSGFRTLRDVVYGGTFEGHTTVGIGVRARLPFRVFVLAGPGAGSRIVIDVAHRWSA